jgi:general secretion pathway protein G
MAFPIGSGDERNWVNDPEGSHSTYQPGLRISYCRLHSLQTILRRAEFAKNCKTASALLCPNKYCSLGFTLIELLIVMAIIAMLLTIALPRYFYNVDRAKEVVLKHNLAQLRDSIDKYYSERGRYPNSLQELAAHNYLRQVPLDPVTDSTATWISIPPDERANGNVFDVKSGAPGLALDGSRFVDW